MDAFDPSTVIPAPFAAAASAAPLASTIFLSSTVRVVELIVVVVPSTCKSPAITTFPVLSPCAEGSMVNVSGPLKYPVVVRFAPETVAWLDIFPALDMFPLFVMFPVLFIPP